MEDAELRQKIEELREKRGGGHTGEERQSASPNFRRKRREERRSLREDFYPPVSYGEPESLLPPELLENGEEDSSPAKPRREEGVGSVFTMQAILAILLAILYVLVLTLAPESAGAALRLVQEKARLDFSFRDSVYDAVGEAITYLNGLENASQPQPDSPSSITEEAEAMGGEYTPTAAGQIPQNCTFTPVVYTSAVLFPIKGGGRVTSPFGFRDHPIHGQEEFHTAVDIAAPQGTPILAAFDGTVVKSEQSDALGNYIVLDHGNDFFSTYAHCDSLIAREGIRIRQGEMIARVGSSGDSTGFHLHFALCFQGLYFNPAYLFPKELHATV